MARIVIVGPDHRGLQFPDPRFQPPTVVGVSPRNPIRGRATVSLRVVEGPQGGVWQWSDEILSGPELVRVGHQATASESSDRARYMYSPRDLSRPHVTLHRASYRGRDQAEPCSIKVFWDRPKAEPLRYVRLSNTRRAASVPLTLQQLAQAYRLGLIYIANNRGDEVPPAHVDSQRVRKGQSWVVRHQVSGLRIEDLKAVPRFVYVGIAEKHLNEEWIRLNSEARERFLSALGLDAPAGIGQVLETLRERRHDLSSDEAEALRRIAARFKHSPGE